MMHREFQYQALNSEGMNAAHKVAEAFDTLLTALLELNPEPSREMSVCRTKLEEASFFAKKAVAFQSKNSVIGDVINLDKR